MPVFASRFRSAASPDFSVTLRCDSQARECRLVHASVGQPELERVEHVERVASLATARFFRSVGSSTPCSAIRASTVEIARSDAVVPRHILFAHAERAPAVRRAVAGVAAGAVPFGPCRIPHLAGRYRKPDDLPKSEPFTVVRLRHRCGVAINAARRSGSCAEPDTKASHIYVQAPRLRPSRQANQDDDTLVHFTIRAPLIRC